MKLSQLFLASSMLITLPQLTYAVEPVWQNTSLSPELRARALVKAMTQKEKLQLIVSQFAAGHGPKTKEIPPGAIGSAGYVPAIKRLGIPAQQISDAGLGVTNPNHVRKGDGATTLPSGQIISGAFDPKLAEEGGAMIGKEAAHRGFNVLLGGGVVLSRSPFNGRNFEYLGEDPLLAGTTAAAEIQGTQSQHVLSTLKHYAFNSIETNRLKVDLKIDEKAGRESDLLAFEIAVKQGNPASIMCAYNKVNGIYACENSYLLQLPKRYWGFTGYYMTDWGAGHSTVQAANAGLDQESAALDFDKKVYFGKPLEIAIKKGEVSSYRLDSMAYRIVYSLIRVGAYDYPIHPSNQPEDVASHKAVAQKIAENGIVLLKNDQNILPLSKEIKNIAIIGGHADKGVISGGGSSIIWPREGNAVPGVLSDGPKLGVDEWPAPVMFDPSSPMAEIKNVAPQAKVQFADGSNIQQAVNLAKNSDVAVVFVTKWSSEAFDSSDLLLPNNQNQLIEAVAHSGKPVVVVLETGNPVEMPWLKNVQSVMAAWFPGSSGGKAIANLLFGKVNPSGRLTMTWPQSREELAYPHIKGSGKIINANPGLPASPASLERQALSSLDLNVEGADVGYRWYEKKGLTPLYPFGYGLSYTSFKYSKFNIVKDFSAHQHNLIAHVMVENTGKKDGNDVVQVYAKLPDGSPKRLVGFAKVFVKAGESVNVTFKLSPITLARYNTKNHGWDIHSGDYKFYATSNALCKDGLQKTVQIEKAHLPD